MPPDYASMADDCSFHPAASKDVETRMDHPASPRVEVTCSDCGRHLGVFEPDA